MSRPVAGDVLGDEPGDAVPLVRGAGLRGIGSDPPDPNGGEDRRSRNP
ncbi:hypothetical protein [Halorubrum halophilum]|nr:hypothetical protein [Halorubrum halophilum]